MTRTGTARWFSAIAASATLALSLGAAPAHAHDSSTQIRILDAHSHVRCVANYLGLKTQHLDLLPCSLGTELLLWKTTESANGTTELRPEWNTSWCLRPGRSGTDELGWTRECGTPATKWRIAGERVMSFRGDCLGEVRKDQAGLIACCDKVKHDPAHAHR
jgi:hypothetical protein